MKEKTSGNRRVQAILSEQEKKLAQAIEREKEIAQGVKKAFLKINPERFKCAESNALLCLLIETYKHLVFFPDKRIIKKFSKVGLLPRHLRRFVSFKDIMKEVKTIGADKKVIILEYQIFLLIREYLETKIVNDLVKWRGFTRSYNRRPFTPKTSILIRDLFRKRKYHGGMPRNCKPGAQEELHTMVNTLNELTNDERRTQKLLSAISEGATEKLYLKQVTECCIHNLSSEAFYSRFFPLFKLLVTDKYFMPEQEFYDHPDAYLGRTYRSYQAIMVKQVVRGDSSFFDSNDSAADEEL